MSGNDEASRVAAEALVHAGYTSPVKRTLKTASYLTCRRAGRDKQMLAILLLFCGSCLAFVGAMMFWTKDMAKVWLLNSLVIENETQIYDWWRDPPVETILKMRIFNYTNAESYLNGTDKKIRLKELGPYVYKARRTKAYVEFDEEDEGEIVSFQENRSYVFVPEMSQGHTEDDPIVVPNMALLGAASVMHDSYYIVRMGLATLLKTLKVEPFMSLRAGEFLWGYNDTLFDLSRNIVPSLSEVPFDRLGVMASLKGVSKDRVSIHTGLRNRSLLGVISKFNGEDSLPYWGDNECNRVDGSEGTIFPLLALPRTALPSAQSSNRLTLFNYELCRRFPLVPTDLVTASGFPAVRFRPAQGVFDDAASNPEHKCFCDPSQSVCPPSGVFNVTPCAYGAPIMASFPHFYMGNPELLEPFEGLNPKKEDHEFTLDIQPVLGVPLGGFSRMQLNAMVRRSKGIWQLNSFPHNMILPIAWFEIGVGELPEHVKSAITLATVTLQRIQEILRWSLLILSLVLMLALVMLITRRIRLDKRNKEAGIVNAAICGQPETTAFLKNNG